MIKLRQKSLLSYFIQPFFVLLLLSGIFGIVWLRSGIISMEYAISELENKKFESLKEAKALSAARASAMSMQRVEKTAVRDLGLALTDRTRVVYVKTGDSGPSKASFEKGYRRSDEGAAIPEGQALRTVTTAGGQGEDRNGGYQ